MITLKKPVSEFSFPKREVVGGCTVSNKCGRDFLYFALHFFYPDRFNTSALSPSRLDSEQLLGVPVPPGLAWTQLQFLFVSRYFKANALRLSINGITVSSFIKFVGAIVFSRLRYERALLEIEQSVRTNSVVGVDISLGWGGLLDHVVFVYGYDDTNLFVFDTHTVAGLEYTHSELHPHVYILPKIIVKKRWTRFGRIWRVELQS